MQRIQTHYDAPGFSFENTSEAADGFKAFSDLHKAQSLVFEDEVSALDLSDITGEGVIALIHDAYIRGLSDGHKVGTLGNGATYTPEEAQNV